MSKFQENLKTERTHSLMQKKNSVSVPKQKFGNSARVSKKISY